MSKQSVDITIQVLKEVLGPKVSLNVEDQIRGEAYARVDKLARLSAAQANPPVSITPTVPAKNTVPVQVKSDKN